VTGAVDDACEGLVLVVSSNVMRHLQGSAGGRCAGAVSDERRDSRISPAATVAREYRLDRLGAVD
jgi:hypothetical protein